MLKDELDKLKAMTAIAEVAFFSPSFDLECERLKQAWLSAFFSQSGKESLDRYFQHHLKGVGEIARTLSFSTELTPSLLSLIDQLRQTMDSAPEIIAPAIYAASIFNKNESALMELKERLQVQGIGKGLHDVLITYLDDALKAGLDGQLTYRALDYYELFLQKLTGPSRPSNECEINSCLLSINFNELNYFSYLTGKWSDQQSGTPEEAAILRKENCRMRSALVLNAVACHPQWPSLKEMATGWLAEELALREAAAHTTSHCAPTAEKEKLALNLSVAQLALIIRLFQEQGLFSSTNLAEIIRFFSAHFRTKRQTVISPVSLRKEIYATGQVTAAGIRGAFQKMLISINQHFFPACLAISAAIFL